MMCWHGKSTVRPKRIEELDREYTLGTWTRQRDFDPTEIVDTEGPRIVTANGDSILDFSSQYVCTSLGYDADRVVDAITEQARTVPYVNPGWSTKPRARLSKKLAEITPGSLKRPSTLPVAPRPMKRRSKSRALTLASTRFFHDTAHTTGDRRFAVRLRRSSTSGARTRDPAGGSRYGEGTRPVRVRVESRPTPSRQSLEYIDEMLELEGDTVAAVLVEPLVGSNGVLTPPDDYLPRLQEIAHDPARC